jgi:hypothetical protein
MDLQMHRKGILNPGPQGIERGKSGQRVELLFSSELEAMQIKQTESPAVHLKKNGHFFDWS